MMLMPVVPKVAVAAAILARLGISTAYVLPAAVSPNSDYSRLSRSPTNNNHQPPTGAFAPAFAPHLSPRRRSAAPPTRLNYASGSSGDSAASSAKQFAKKLKELVQSRKRGSAKAAHDFLLGRIDEAAGSADSSTASAVPLPDVIAFTRVISALARDSRNRNSADHAQQLFQRMLDLADEHQRDDLRPNIYTYNALINAYARRGMVDQAEQILERMQSGDDGRIVEPDRITYNSVINAWASSSSGGGRNARKEAAERALEIMELMKNTEGSADCKPDAVTYGSVIKCLTNSGGRDSAERAQELLNEMEELGKNNGDDVRPNTIVYNSVLNAWARRGQTAEAEAILDRMEDIRASGANDDVGPDAFTFSSLIKAWTSSGEDGAAERATQLLDRMEELYRDGDEDLRPNNVVYNAVIHAWAKSGQAGSAERAEELLARMQDLSKKRERDGDGGGGKGGGGDESLRADTITFNSVIDAWAKSEEYGSAERAEELLNSMERQYLAGDDAVRPDVRTFNSVINAWASTGGPGCGMRAEQLLDKIESLHKETGDEDVKPNTVTYASVINAHARSHKKGCGEFAEAILDHMEEMYEDGNDDARPNPIAFSALMTAWANSEVGLSAPRAESLLKRMMANMEEGNGRDLAYANKVFDLVTRTLDQSSDEDTVERIELMRQGNILRNVRS